jgi:hypothetical protein
MTGGVKKIHSDFYPWPISTSIYPVRYSNQYRRLRVPVKSLLSATLLLSSYLAMHTRDVWFGQLFHNTLRMRSSKEQEFMELLNLIQHTFIFISMGSGLTGVVNPDTDPNGSLHFHADPEQEVQIGLMIRIPDPDSGSRNRTQEPLSRVEIRSQTCLKMHDPDLHKTNAFKFVTCLSKSEF